MLAKKKKKKTRNPGQLLNPGEEQGDIEDGGDSPGNDLKTTGPGEQIVKLRSSP